MGADEAIFPICTQHRRGICHLKSDVHFQINYHIRATGRFGNNSLYGTKLPPRTMRSFCQGGKEQLKYG